MLDWANRRPQKEGAWAGLLWCGGGGAVVGVVGSALAGWVRGLELLRPVCRQAHAGQRPGRLHTPLPADRRRTPPTHPNRPTALAGWVVLSLPAGTIKLHEPLAITRPQTVLRGAGSGRTKLAISSPLREAWGERGVGSA